MELILFDKLKIDYIKEIIQIRNECVEQLIDNRKIRLVDMVAFYLLNIKTGREKVYFIKNENNIIGYMNEKYISPAICEIGIKIKQEYRGQKLGHEALSLLIKQIFNGPTTEIIAEIKKDNIISQNLFKFLGFNITQEKETTNIWSLKKE